MRMFQERKREAKVTSQAALNDSRGLRMRSMDTAHAADRMTNGDVSQLAASFHCAVALMTAVAASYHCTVLRAAVMQQA